MELITRIVVKARVVFGRAIHFEDYPSYGIPCIVRVYVYANHWRAWVCGISKRKTDAGWDRLRRQIGTRRRRRRCNHVAPLELLDAQDRDDFGSILLLCQLVP